MAAGLDDHPSKTQLRLSGTLALAVMLAILALVWGLFDGRFTHYVALTMIAPRSGLVMDPGAKVTFHGVEIGRVSEISEFESGDGPKARLTLEVEPRYIDLLPANAVGDITASTVFGNKYVQLRLPPDPSPQRANSVDPIDGLSVTTEFNTLFETVTSIAETVDPVKLNMTLSATAEALTGLGSRFGESLVDGDTILADINPLMPQVHRDIVQLTSLTDIYAAALPDLLDALDQGAATAQTLTSRQAELDATLLAATGFGNRGADVFGRAAPYFLRDVHDLVPSAELLDEYSPEIVCTVRGLAEAGDYVRGTLGNNGYSLSGVSSILGAENPYVYPDNLPRVNATGGPGGAPGCWATITRDLWPTPYLVMDTGISIAPYNHFELGQPILTEYVWGRQGGEPTINP